MDQEIVKKMQQINMKQIENQLVFQCAPLITGLKISNLFVMKSEHWQRICSLLQKNNIHCHILYQADHSLTALLYRPLMLSAYLHKQQVSYMLSQEGYAKIELDWILTSFTRRYQKYRMGLQPFPHELGLLLGYPWEDVAGFVQHNGSNSLYTGYWKVYANVPSKRQLFRKYEYAREQLLEKIAHGNKLEQILSEPSNN